MTKVDQTTSASNFLSSSKFGEDSDVKHIHAVSLLAHPNYLAHFFDINDHVIEFRFRSTFKMFEITFLVHFHLFELCQQRVFLTV